nr:histidine phosphatase family protein [Paenibacillus bovis]
MNKSIFVVRHCKAVGQQPEAQLTEEGINQSLSLVRFFSTYNIDRIISSPFTRAIQSITPYAKKRNINIEIDNRLAERTLSNQSYHDWMEKLKKTFTDMDLKYDSGESSREAQARIKDVIDDIITSSFSNTIIVTHGNLMALLLKNYIPEYGFDNWMVLRNPDVYHIRWNDGKYTVECIW